MSEAKTAPETGWGNPSPLTQRGKSHYFTEDRRSLCGRWMRFAGSFELEDANDNHLDNCAACKKKIAGHRAAKAKGAPDANPV